MNPPPTPPLPHRALNSWRWMLPLAAMPLLSFLAFGTLGGRDCIQILTGIHPFSPLEVVTGAAYLASYFALTFLSPVLAIAAGLVALRDLRLSRRRPA